MKVKIMSLYYRQANTLRVSSHSTQPVVAEDSKHAHFQHQVPIKTHTHHKQQVLTTKSTRSAPSHKNIHLCRPSSSVHTCWWQHMCIQKVIHILPSRLQGWTGPATAGWWATRRQAEPAAWPHSTTGWHSHYEYSAGGSVGRESEPKTGKKEKARTRWSAL